MQRADTSQVPGFLAKTYDLLEEGQWSDMISWNKAGDAIVVKDSTALAETVLPRLFKHNNYTSFVRQLNNYGFTKITKTRNESAANGIDEFRNDLFKKGQRYMLRMIQRKVPDMGGAASQVTKEVSQAFALMQDKLVESEERLASMAAEMRKFRSTVQDQITQLWQENKTLRDELNRMRRQQGLNPLDESESAAAAAQAATSINCANVLLECLADGQGHMPAPPQPSPAVIHHHHQSAHTQEVPPGPPGPPFLHPDLLRMSSPMPPFSAAEGMNPPAPGQMMGMPGAIGGMGGAAHKWEAMQQSPAPAAAAATDPSAIFPWAAAAAAASATGVGVHTTHPTEAPPPKSDQVPHRPPHQALLPFLSPALPGAPVSPQPFSTDRMRAALLSGVLSAGLAQQHARSLMQMQQMAGRFGQQTGPGVDASEGMMPATHAAAAAAAAAAAGGGGMGASMAGLMMPPDMAMPDMFSLGTTPPHPPPSSEFAHLPALFQATKNEIAAADALLAKAPATAAASTAHSETQGGSLDEERPDEGTASVAGGRKRPQDALRSGGRHPSSSNALTKENFQFAGGPMASPQRGLSSVPYAPRPSGACEQDDKSVSGSSYNGSNSPQLADKHDPSCWPPYDQTKRPRRMGVEGGVGDGFDASHLHGHGPSAAAAAAAGDWPGGHGGERGSDDQNDALKVGFDFRSLLELPPGALAAAVAAAAANPPSLQSPPPT
ncbi:unnamed protein product [Vitrella brassicaformis CCMP3155]|uniref:HSF-type DNA-binding domain-containing protein n=2 Tax=Vitrella brassicaformis TaxID=1169539 RepID=A0A0G4F4T1_VITBC|nr:unnamed protein product [Vitrella brassicaformis CCMP3155]|mmetsp:Transcript_9585/g.27626  ORF Transcript_9585/g.27626 Transcript_9585/m.27626 type:complete len:719 (+) Transcript_9585:160-2316(+)|eukprot:CEM06939.1 unnamed protein product [Vitrella brassicaformis CCMP3155]